MPIAERVRMKYPKINAKRRIFNELLVEASGGVTEFTRIRKNARRLKGVRYFNSSWFPPNNLEPFSFSSTMRRKDVCRDHF